jgi:predicted small lipoprotein YifL
MKQSIRILILVPALALSGCGQKGPLYLPEHNEVVISAPVSPGATEATPQPLPEDQGASSSSSASKQSSSSSSSNPPQ